MFDRFLASFTSTNRIDVSSHNASVGQELRNALRTVLAGLEPAIQGVAEYGARSGSTPGRCQQTWCPLCATTALVAGEHHPLSALVAEHAAPLLAVIREMVDADTHSAGERDQPRPSSYQPIPVTVVE